MAKSDVEKHTPIEVALVPLVIYIFSCIGSFSCEKFYSKFGRFYFFFLKKKNLIGGYLERKHTYLIGALILSISSIFMSVKLR